jgi:phosphoglycolate phosphatase-like HAD superfamily hydrolase
MSKNNEFETGRNKHSKKAIIFDLDGTLADTKDYEALHKIDSDEFRKVAKNADDYPHIVALAKEAHQQGRDVIILTARSAHYRTDTKEWLHRQGVHFDQLYMRPIGNDKNDKKVKKKILQDQILPNFEVKKAYDDKKKNVKMFRKEGIDAKKVN